MERALPHSLEKRLWEGLAMPIRFVVLKKKNLTALCAALAAVAVIAAVNAAPAAVSAAATTRQLPIYCVARDQKVCSISFDAAWRDGSVRRQRLCRRRRRAAQLRRAAYAWLKSRLSTPPAPGSRGRTRRRSPGPPFAPQDATEGIPPRAARPDGRAPSSPFPARGA